MEEVLSPVNSDGGGARLEGTEEGVGTPNERICRRPGKLQWAPEVIKAQNN